MATSLSTGTMTVTLTEAIKINGYDQGSSNTLTVTGVRTTCKRIVTILSAAEVGILGFNAAESTDMGKSYVAGQFDEDTIKYIRITNKDAANYILLTIRNSGNSDANEVGIKLDKGCSFIYGADLDSGTEATVISSTSALSLGTGATLNDLIDIVGIANTGDVDIEVFVATT